MSEKNWTPEELEAKAKAEGIDLEHPEGQERFDAILSKAAKSAKHDKKRQFAIAVVRSYGETLSLLGKE